MPITPARRALYPHPKDWALIRAAVLERARDKCEGCGVRNHALGWRHRDGRWQESQGCCEDDAPAGWRPIEIILTVHHQDGDPQNNDGWGDTGRVLPLEESNLRAYCQQCHNRADGPLRSRHAAETRERKRMEPYRGGLFADRGSDA